MSSKILLVDDDLDDLEIYKHLFGDIDPHIAVSSYSNPRDALEKLETAARLPDLVILDFNMPQMNGLDFLKVVRENPTLASLPVTVITTSCNPRDVEKLLRLGAECHQKPGGLGEFRALIEKLIRQQG